MKWLFGLIFSIGLLVSPALVQAQAINPGESSSSSPLQGTGASLQQSGVGFQGTSPQNLSAPSLSALNQNPRGATSSSIALKPSETTTSVTGSEASNSSNPLKFALAASLAIIAGLILWRQKAKL